MKTSHLICCSALLATTLVSLPSCKDDSTTPQQSVQQKASTGLSAEKRASVYSALALLPQNVSSFVVATNIGGNLTRLAESGTIPGLTLQDMDAKALALDNVALATTTPSAATYALMTKLLKGLTLLSAADTLGDPLGDDLLREGVKTMGITLSADKVNVDADWQQAHIPAGYAVITAKPGNEAVLDELYTSILGDLQNCDRAWKSPVNDANGFSGVRMDLTKWAEYNAADDELSTCIRELAVRHNICALVRRQGNAIILAVCEDPQELKLAATPEDSVLATDLLTPFDANIDKGMIAAAHLSKELLTVYRASGLDGLLELAPVLAGQFTQRGEQDAANKAAFDKAATAMTFLGNQLKQFCRPITQPCEVQLWCDEALHYQATGDAQGASYKPGKLHLAEVGKAPSTIFYVESTPCDTNLTLPGTEALVDALTDVAQGYALTTSGYQRSQIETGISMVQAFKPEVLAFSQALSTIGDGLDGHSAMVLDAAPAALPALMGTNTTVEMPRLSFYAGVTDRSKLGSGWDSMLVTAGQVATKLGTDPSVINMLPIVPAQVGDATSYKVALPFFTQDFVPSLTVSAQALALGTSDNLNTQLVTSATGTMDYAGAVFSFRPAALAKCLGSLAEALNSQGASNDMQQAAAVATMFSGVVESVSGSSTIDKGIHTISVDVTFAK